MRLTIVIPTVDRAYCLRRAVESALAQTSTDIEVLVSNNASTDGTRELLEALVTERRDARLRVVHHDERLPITAHGNYLVSEARGDYFLGLSDDDWLEPTFAARVLALFDRQPDLAFVYGGCWMHAGPLALPSPTGPELEDSAEFLSAYLAGRRQVYWCACVTRTADLRRIGPLPADRLIGDMYYWTKLLTRAQVGCVGEHLAHYTYLADNTSIGIPAVAWARETALLVEEMVAQLRRLDPPAELLVRARRDARRYLARSSANQLALNARRGAPKSRLLRSAVGCASYLSAAPLTVAPRVAAALLLPPALLRYLTDAFVRRRAARSV